MERDYVRGYQDGSFGPSDSCSRQQFVIMLWRLAGRPSADTDGAEVSFSDITPATPGYGAILWAVSRGIIRGYDDGTFRPDEKVTCEQALQRLKEWNGVLPKDCNFITLRLPVGPKACNPQWVFGDVYELLFIDAVTGEVKGSNPAF